MAPVKLSSLHEWSQEHIKSVFEARDDAVCIAAIDRTFSDNVTASINGNAMTRQDIIKLVFGLRAAAPDGLKVHWENGLDVPKDPETNRDGTYACLYTLTGVKVGGVPYQRNKSAHVVIDSQSSDPNVDSRRITNLAFIAVNVKQEGKYAKL